MAGRLAFLTLLVGAFVAARLNKKATLTSRPGPVNVQDFVDGTEKHDVPVNELKSEFLRLLSETRIYPPYAGPSAPTPTDFFGAVGNAAEGNGSVSLFLARCLARLWPKHGYQVSVTLLTRNHQPQYGVSVSVFALAWSDRSAMETQWGKSWQDATSKAAYWVMATILPATRQAGRSQVWRNWRGKQLPWELFRAYTEGRHSQDSRQYDQALWWYNEALRLDPYNQEIRLIVANAMEEMGLYLEALDIYHGAMTYGELGDQYTNCLWSTKRYRILHPLVQIWRPLRHLWKSRSSILLRHRYAAVLANPDKMVHEWFVSDAEGERKQVRQQISQRLRTAFSERYWPLVAQYQNDPERAKRELRTLLDPTVDCDWRRNEVSLVFQLAALQELSRLHENVGMLSIFDLKSSVRRCRLRLARDVRIPLLLLRTLREHRRNGRKTSIEPESSDAPLACSVADAIAVDSLAVRGFLQTWWPWWRRRAFESYIRDWPPSVADVDRAVSRVQRRTMIPWNHLDYLDYFDAARAYAIPLFADSADENSQSQFAHKSVEQLRASIACTASEAAVHLRTWILSSEPDLFPLRRRPEFRDFERDFYPGLKLVRPRPDEAMGVRSVAYARQLIWQGAALLHECWRDRAGRGGAVADIVDWLDRDVQLWQALRRMAEDRAWYWRDRSAFIHLVNEVVGLETSRTANFPPSLPRFDEVDIPGADDLVTDDHWLSGQIDKLAGTFVKEVDELFRPLLVLIAEYAASNASRRQLINEAGDSGDGRPQWSEIRRLCAERASQWWSIAWRMRELPLTIDEHKQADQQLRP